MPEYDDLPPDAELREGDEFSLNDIGEWHRYDRSFASLVATVRAAAGDFRARRPRRAECVLDLHDDAAVRAKLAVMDPVEVICDDGRNGPALAAFSTDLYDFVLRPGHRYRWVVEDLGPIPEEAPDA